MAFPVTQLPYTAVSSAGKGRGRDGRASPGLGHGRCSGSGKGPRGRANCPGVHLLSTWVTHFSRGRIRVPATTPDLFILHPSHPSLVPKSHTASSGPPHTCCPPAWNAPPPHRPELSLIPPLPGSLPSTQADLSDFCPCLLSAVRSAGPKPAVLFITVASGESCAGHSAHFLDYE